MLSFILRRVLAVIPVLLIVAMLVFGLLRMVPGDPAAVIAGDAATNEQVRDIRERLGLEKPIPVQFAIWLGRLVQGDLGQSFFFKKPVADLIAQRFEPTLALGVCALVLAV